MEFEGRLGCPPTCGLLWLKDTSPEDADSLPESAVSAQEIAEDLPAAMELFAGIANEPQGKSNQPRDGDRPAGLVANRCPDRLRTSVLHVQRGHDRYRASALPRLYPRS